MIDDRVNDRMIDWLRDNFPCWSSVFSSVWLNSRGRPFLTPSVSGWGREETRYHLGFNLDYHMQAGDLTIETPHVNGDLTRPLPWTDDFTRPLPWTGDLTWPPPVDRWHLTSLDPSRVHTGGLTDPVSLRTGVVDSAGGPAHPHHRPVHLHHRPALRGRTQPRQRHLDAGHPRRAPQRHGPVRLSDQHQTAAHHHCQLHCHWWVASAADQSGYFIVIGCRLESSALLVGGPYLNRHCHYRTASISIPSIRWMD